ncbi:MAG TPA: pepsin/retropepsin-like aspartic protease family protein [Ignavibacteriales bacterium]|nr:pepsin/retropepsin-like aspartic protease family protein [Ignavibacteriales bacterium]
MRIKFILTWLFLFLFSAPVLLKAESYSDLKKLFESKRYFELRDALEKETSEDIPIILFLKGAVSNKFNQLDRSISYIRKYLKKTGGNLSAEYMTESYDILADNYVKSYQYKKAAESYQVILDRFTSFLDEGKIEDIKNSLRLWNAFRGVPPQSVSLKGDTRLKTEKDKVGLTNIPVEINGRKLKFIFDTGAGISSITKSYARMLHFRIVDDSIAVSSFTGSTVYASLGIAPIVKIGNAVIKNSVFLIFNDNDLSVPSLGYQCNGIIGFPVIESLGEVTLTKSGSLIIPEKAGRHFVQNMCLAGLSPIILGEFNGRKLSFNLDTGARSSILYQSFFQNYEQSVKENSEIQTKELAGAGGSKKLTVYRLKNFNINISGRNAGLDQVTVLTEPLNENNLYFYGNLGQDIIGQFDRMTLNFETMSLILE